MNLWVLCIPVLNLRFSLNISFNFYSTADIYAFLVVFVLPLNSAVNPILYTFTTPKYRNQVLLRGWNKLTSRKIVRNDGSGHTGSGSNQGRFISNVQRFSYYNNKQLSQIKMNPFFFFKFILFLRIGRSLNSNLSRSRRTQPDEDHCS